MEKRAPTSSYCPIKNYAIIGDCRCAALVSNRGSIDWLCLPRFDSPAWFAAILDSERGGSFLIQPADDFTADQAYINHTNLVQTSFKTKTGVLRLTDFMPIHSLETQRNQLHPERDLLRSAECMDGEVALEFRYTPRPDYGRAIPRLTKRGALGLFCEYKGTVLVFRTDFPAEFSPERGCAWGRARLRKGERCTFSLSFAEGEPAILPSLGAQAGSLIQSTVQWWNRWSSSCSYEGPYRKEVLRSALALKRMTYAPSGAVIAAPTTSLPEKIGGVRNWDYRYCWLRDASMTLRALYRLGYKDEGASFLSWLLHTTRLTRPELQVVYNVYGEKRLEEQELKHLEGYAKSSPVRIGNNATEQKQIDIYGEVLDAAYDFVQ